MTIKELWYYLFWFQLFLRCRTNTWLLYCWDVEFYFLGLMYFYCKHCRVCSSSFEWTQKSHPLVKSSIPCYRVGLNEIFWTGLWNSPVRTINQTQNVLWFINIYIYITLSLFADVRVISTALCFLLLRSTQFEASKYLDCFIDILVSLHQFHWTLWRCISGLAYIQFMSTPSSLIRGPKTETTGPQIRIPPPPSHIYAKKAICSMFWSCTHLLK